MCAEGMWEWLGRTEQPSASSGTAPCGRRGRAAPTPGATGRVRGKGAVQGCTLLPAGPRGQRADQGPTSLGVSRGAERRDQRWGQRVTPPIPRPRGALGLKTKFQTQCEVQEVNISGLSNPLVQKQPEELSNISAGGEEGVGGGQGAAPVPPCSRRAHGARPGVWGREELRDGMGVSGSRSQCRNVCP